MVIFISLLLSLAVTVMVLFITGYPLGFMTFLGFVALSAIVANNGILLLNNINQRRLEGLDGRAAIVDASVVSNKVAYLNTITTIGALLPLALGGGSLWAPFTWVIIIGTVILTVSTLIVLSAGYAFVEQL